MFSVNLTPCPSYISSLCLLCQALCPDWENDKAVLEWVEADQSSLKEYLDGLRRYVPPFVVQVWLFSSVEHARVFAAYCLKIEVSSIAGSSKSYGMKCMASDPLRVRAKVAIWYGKDRCTQSIGKRNSFQDLLSQGLRASAARGIRDSQKVLV